MPNAHTRNRLGMTMAEMTAVYLDHRDDEVLDGAVTAAALIARADGDIKPVERGVMLGILDRDGLLSVFTRAEVLDAFASRVRQLEGHGGAEAALDDLRRLAGRPPARLIIETGERVAAADSRIHAAEFEMLRLIFSALGRRSDTPCGGSPDAAGRHLRPTASSAAASPLPSGSSVRSRTRSSVPTTSQVAATRSAGQGWPQATAAGGATRP